MQNSSMKTKEVKFYLKNKKNGWGSIVGIFNFGYVEDGQYRFYQHRVGEDIPIECWDKEDQRIKKGSIPDYARINKKLNNLETEIIEKYDEMVKNKLEVNPISLRVYLKNTTDNQRNDVDSKPKGKTTLIGFAKSYKDTCGKNYKTTRHYGTTINVLDKFSKSRKTKLFFDDIDMTFYRSFVKYLEGENLRINTIGGHLKNLKVFLRQSFNQKIHENKIFEHRDFKVLQEDVDSIYLTKEELGKIYRLDLSDNKTLEQTRDAFVLGAFTGLRFSDIQNLKPENIGIDGIIKTTAIKTKKQVCIPIGNVTKLILKKYFPQLPRIYSNQKFNDYLKIIAEQAGLLDDVTITHSNGGVHTPYKYKKFELVSTHTARRSFATNMMLEGVPIGQIMMITGHKTQESFFKYIKIRPNDNAAKLKDHPFFNYHIEEVPQIEGQGSSDKKSNKKKSSNRSK
jgi:site-specific recombinase XerD